MDKSKSILYLLMLKEQNSLREIQNFVLVHMLSTELLANFCSQLHLCNL